MRLEWRAGKSHAVGRPPLRNDSRVNPSMGTAYNNFYPSDKSCNEYGNGNKNMSKGLFMETGDGHRGTDLPFPDRWTIWKDLDPPAVSYV